MVEKKTMPKKLSLIDLGILNKDFSEMELFETQLNKTIILESVRLEMNESLKSMYAIINEQFRTTSKIVVEQITQIAKLPMKSWKGLLEITLVKKRNRDNTFDYYTLE